MGMTEVQDLMEMTVRVAVMDKMETEVGMAVLDLTAEFCTGTSLPPYVCVDRGLLDVFLIES